MAVDLKKGIAVWILGFLTFLAAINVFNAVMHGVEKNAGDTINLYLIKYMWPNITLSDYFWISVTVTCVLLALTSITACRRSPDPHLLQKIDELEESTADNTETIRITQTSLLKDIETDKKTREEFLNKIDMNLIDTRKETLSMLEKTEKMTQKTSRNLQSTKAEIMSTREEYAKSTQQINTSLESVTKEVESILRSGMRKQTAQIKKTTKSVERLEEKLLPRSILTSRSEPENIKGIGPRLGEELRALGITTVGDLITADPGTLAKKTRVSNNTMRHLQAIAQLTMIPSINGEHAELLEKAGITTRKALAAQEPIQLSKKLEKIAKTYIEKGRLDESKKPTIEEITSWIRQATI
jgi:predicted flap endonuclease-1-like 5' DNA nuclease